jgi:hypothetical protein
MSFFIVSCYAQVLQEMLTHFDIYVPTVSSVISQLTTMPFLISQLELPKLEIHVC